MIDHLPGRAPAALALGGLGCGQALAQQTAAEPDGLTVYDRHLPTAGTASRLGLTPFETPASVTVIDGDAIRDRGDTSVVDAITRAPGISSNASPGNGGTAVTARGFSGHGAVVQLYDGNRFYVGAGTLTFPFDTWMDDFVLYAQSATHAGHLGSLITMPPGQVDFDLTTGQQWEVGLKQALPGGLGEWTLAGYHVVRRNLLSTDPEDPLVTRQIGRRSSRGVETAVALELAPQLHLHGNLALLNARYDDFVQLVGGEPVSRAGNTPTGIPERTANAQLRWGFAPDWHASVGWRYVGPRWLNADNTVRMPSYDVADATVGWRVNETVSLTLRGRNLFDTVYAVSGGMAQWRLGEDRTFELSADLRF